MVDGDGTVANLMGPQAPGAQQRTFPGWYHAPGSTSAYQAAAAAGGWRRGAGNNRWRTVCLDALSESGNEAQHKGRAG